MSTKPGTGVLLPPEIAAKSSRWFGRAHNYPIYSVAWLRYRSLSMLLGSLLIILLGLALLGAYRGREQPAEIDLAKALEGAVAYLVTAAAAIVIGPTLAVAARRLRLRPRFETMALAALLGLGVFLSFGIVMKEAMSWYGRASYNARHDVMEYGRLVTMLDMTFSPRPVAARIGLRDPALADAYVAAYDGFARAFGLPDRVVAGWPHFVNAADRRLLAALRAPGLTAQQLRALETPYAQLLEKVYDETHAMQYRGIKPYRKNRRKDMTPLQHDAERKLLASMQAEPPPRAPVERQLIIGVGRASHLAMVLAYLALFAWLGGVFELRAFVRQRGMLGEAQAKQELARARAERDAAETRLSVLAAQVEPHFLFNTLASVRAAIATDPQRAGHIVDHMTDYLRSTIPQMRGDAASSTVALDTQLAAARAYLALMHERMRRLAFKVEAEPGLEQAAIPPLMLISLVENAVKHGVEPKVGAAHVDVRARRLGDDLEVSVSDDGVGFGATVSGSGIGLANIQQRLATLYGERASLTLKAGAQGGVAATLRLPFDTVS